MSEEEDRLHFEINRQNEGLRRITIETGFDPDDFEDYLRFERFMLARSQAATDRMMRIINGLTTDDFHPPISAAELAAKKKELHCARLGIEDSLKEQRARSHVVAAQLLELRRNRQ